MNEKKLSYVFLGLLLACLLLMILFPHRIGVVRRQTVQTVSSGKGATVQTVSTGKGALPTSAVAPGSCTEAASVPAADVVKDDVLITGFASKDRKSTRLNSSHSGESRMPSSA